MNRLTKFLLTAGAALCLLTACGDDSGPLEAYTLGESGESVVALDSILAEGEAMMASIDAPTDAATEAGLAVSHTYHYRQMEDPAALAARYIGVLRGEEGFTPIDDQNQELAEEPNMETLSGSMILARALETGDSKVRKLFRMVVAWSEYSVAVQVAEVDGRILPPPEPEKEEADNAAGGGAPVHAASMSEQVEYFNGLEPSKLGLEGSDMSEYLVYPQQGRVTVDGITCRAIMVYLPDVQDGENVYIGTYYLSSDLEHMFKKQDTGSLVVVENFK